VSGAPDAARAAVARFAAAAGLPPTVRLKAELIAEELVANTLSHGLPPPGSAIDLRLRLEPAGLLLEYVDRGCAFDPTRHLSPRQADPWHVGGFGWDIVRGICSEVQYDRADGENRLRLHVPVV